MLSRLASQLTESILNYSVPYALLNVQRLVAVYLLYRLQVNFRVLEVFQ